MKEEELEQLRYPIGYFECPESITQVQLKDWILTLTNFPKKLEELVENLSDSQLNTPYRPDGWTVRQVIHHIADSHHNSYTRFKWALTEDAPLIKVYDEKNWSNLFDAKTAPIQISLDYIKVVHAKIVFLLNGLSDEQFQQYYIHPEGKTKVSVAENTGKYVWHGNHHYAHIKNLIKRNGWG